MCGIDSTLYYLGCNLEMILTTILNKQYSAVRMVIFSNSPEVAGRYTQIKFHKMIRLPITTNSRHKETKNVNTNARNEFSQNTKCTKFVRIRYENLLNAIELDHYNTVSHQRKYGNAAITNQFRFSKKLSKE